MSYIPNMKYLQARAGLSNVKLAALAGVSSATIQNMRASISVTSRIAYMVQRALQRQLNEMEMEETVQVEDEEEEPALASSHIA